jgi:hypothetical protein
MVSMVSSFSSTLISLSGRTGIGMTESYHSAGEGSIADCERSEIGGQRSDDGSAKVEGRNGK